MLSTKSLGPEVAEPEAENPASVEHFKLMGCTFIRALTLSRFP